jgi:hypothetical protein
MKGFSLASLAGWQVYLILFAIFFILAKGFSLGNLFSSLW